MIIQEILTYIIVAFAFGYTIRGAYKLVVKKETSCSSGSCGCDSKHTLVNAIKAGKKPYILK